MRIFLSACVVSAFYLQASALQEDPQAGSPSSQVEVQGWVNVEAVNLRGGPGTNHSAIRMLTVNDSVRVLRKVGRWVEVEWVHPRGDAIQGWIFGRYLSDKPLTQKEVERLKIRPKESHPAVNIAALVLVAIAFIYLIRRGYAAKRTRKASRVSGGVITGKPYIVDGDTIKLAGKRVRISGIEAPEMGQPARERGGLRFLHGEFVKEVLFDEIQGKTVRVKIEGRGKYGVPYGVVTCNGKDIGAWLVRNGNAIAAYGDKYKHLELKARKAKRGMWGYAKYYDPRRWKAEEKARKRAEQARSRGASYRR